MSEHHQYNIFDPPKRPDPPPPAMATPSKGSLAEARLELMEKGRWEKPYGVLCPCCDQRAKVYLRPLHRSMARSLIRLYRYWAINGPEAWVNISQFLSYNVSVGDAPKLMHFGLIEPRRGETLEDGNPNVGLYRSTELGWRFLRGEVTVPRAVAMYNAEMLFATDERITLEEALGEPFNYSELMQPVEKGGAP